MANGFSFPAMCRLESDYAKTGSTAVYHLNPGQLKAAANAFNNRGWFLEDITCLDVEEGILVLYHFDHMERAEARVTLRVLVPHDDAVLPSIGSVFGAAYWHEREAQDMHGMTFTDHPNPLPLLLPEDADFHPLLHDEKRRKSARDILEEYHHAYCWPSFVKIEEEPNGEAAEEGGQEAAGEEG
ncbi:NADH-quinone oxidoreductase subunit C [Desulfohalovibrio reitneri]|uniref:NADH-quinone oxidoreductase subunit C n=1 Tax=Desulfohalovibrio reitneri TaxID=1307759 RepID=UPI00068C5ED2|nr:NADH-quinone oxidoreductase subunit C [Desulfohalovibrio reitneri]